MSTLLMSLDMTPSHLPTPPILTKYLRKIRLQYHTEHNLHNHI
jgi:hypothetical protein